MTGALAPSTLAAFVAVTLVAYVVPGPDWLIIFQLASRRRGAGIAAALGTQSSLCVHVALAVVGVSALLVRLPVALTVLKVLGAIYLVFLGIRIVVSARREWRSTDSAADVERRRPVGDDAGPGAWEAFLRGFGTNILNPKAALFFLSVVPQFVDPSRPAPAQILYLGIVDVVLGLLWWACFVLVSERVGTALTRPVVRWRVDLVTGGILALVGLAVPLL